MKNGICYIVGAGENYGLEFERGMDDLVIAADAGLNYLEEKKIVPDLIVGDFDTLQYVPRGKNVLKLPAEKDDTDMSIAIKEGIRAGYGKFHIYCGTGGRIDHTIANLQMLSYLSEHGKQGLLFDKDCVLTAITDREIFFEKIDSGYISIFSCSDRSVGVYLRRLKYELHDATLTNSFPLGVSNEFNGMESSIAVKKGTLLISFPRGAERKIRWSVEEGLCNS
ncbi:MAG: thiamine diphosphokinase [Lachnospiraceae bacterium]|jgi:thiamine pyrophosphokinase|nr:thiamine diphosphokinase [Lachnospiraceae bacterium]